MIKKMIVSALLAATVLTSSHASTSSLAKGVELWQAFKCSHMSTVISIEEKERLFNVGMDAGSEFCAYMSTLSEEKWTSKIAEGYSQLPLAVIISEKKVSCDFFLGQVYSASIEEVYMGFDLNNSLNKPYWQQRYNLANCYYIGR